MKIPRHRLQGWCVLTLVAALATPPLEARREKLALRSLRLDLPAAPSAIVSADVNLDGRRDLVVAVAYTAWGQIGVEESYGLDEIGGAGDVEGIEGLVEVLTIVPALVDRRELWVFLRQADGNYRAEGGPLPLETSILSIEAGPPGLPVIALTDDGISALRPAGEALIEGGPTEEAGAPPAFRFEPVLEDRPVLAGTGTFLSGLDLSQDLNGDGHRDLLLPARRTAAVYLSDGHAGLKPTQRLPLPQDERTHFGRVRHYPLPVVRDVDGDGLVDLLQPDHRRRWNELFLQRNRGDGRFEAPRAPLDELAPELLERGLLASDDEGPTPQIVHFGDLDGDGRAEYVTQQEPPDLDDAGLRAEMRQAKRPPHVYRFYRMDEAFRPRSEPYQTLTAEGYAFDTSEGDGEDEGPAFPGGFQDLDGDGRQDLIALTLDFSLFQAVKILTVKRISIGIDFHVWCQGENGTFRPVSGLDLSGKFNLNLNNLRIGQLSQFAGDFDGDGRADFVQMGRGRTVTIHRGRPGCAYPVKPDLTVELEEAPRDLRLVQVRDLDGDELTDLLVIHPRKKPEAGVTAPVSLDLYLSDAGTGGAP